METRKVYVATTFSRYGLARDVIDLLTEAGHTVTHDWTRTDAFGPDGRPISVGVDGYGLTGEALLTDDVQRRHAEEDLAGVADADLLLAIGDMASCGWLLEVGFALGNGIPRDVWVVAPFADTVFWRLPTVTVFHDLPEPLARLGVEASR